jgi:pyruvate dehydrogenase E2 component (dihydrolipoamide acetyltransferase)
MSTVTMPSLVDSMSDGVISRWLKREGERVERDEELVEIETDKVTMAYPAPGSGYLEIVVSEGTTVPVGEVIARLAQAPSTRTGAEAAPRAEGPQPGREDGAAPSPAADAPRVGRAAGPEAEVRATPLARELADRHGLSLGSVGGSGPRGRVTRTDVASSLAIPPAAPVARPEPPGPAAEPGAREPSRLQQTVARRTSEAHATIPDFQVETEVVMDAALALREEFKRLGDDEPIPSLNDFLIRASALALREHPRVNASYAEGRFVRFEHVNVGFAVAADDALLVPTIRDADARSLWEIAAESRRLAERVRRSTITPAELASATFTISNLGMFGMTAITPIIDAPQAAILGAGSIRETLALEEGAVRVRRLMTLRLSCDHRILYGADAARFLSRVRELLEQPLRLLR